MNESIQSSLKAKFPELVGELKINKINNILILSGDISVSDKKLFSKFLNETINAKHPNTLISNSLKINEFVVIEEVVEVNKEFSENLDEVNVIYYGLLDIEHIIPNDEFKTIHQNNRIRLNNIVRVLNFISPLVLDSNLKVIDGNFRLQLAKENDIKQVMVAIIDDNGKRANFLRLALNRTAEFQRWNYREVDDFVDFTPQAQPLLEPIGFFGKYVLPTSFFSDTVIQYVIDPFNEKQKQYSQEEGLAEWAKYRREQMAKLSAEKRVVQPKPANAMSLFDLSPKKEDFLETYDINQEMDEFVEKYKKIAGDITDRSDAIKKAEIEEKGGVWQRQHRSSQEVADTRRIDAIEAIQETDLLTEQEKLEVIDNIDDYAGFVNNIEDIAQMLREVK